MRQRGDVRMSKDPEAVLIHRLPVRQLTVLLSVSRVFKGLSGDLTPCLVVLLFVGFRGAPMRMGRNVMQLGGPLVVLVVRSVVVTSRHNDLLTSGFLRLRVGFVNSYNRVRLGHDCLAFFPVLDNFVVISAN
jgi:hypothetical protein